MTRPHRASPGVRFLLSLVPAVFAAVLGGCFRTDTTTIPQGTEVENELGVGRLLFADGSPARDALVRIFKVDEIPLPAGSPKRGAADFITRTDARGRFRADGLAPGVYNILGESDNAFSYRDSVSLDSKRPLPTDTLRAPGAVRGIVGVQPHHDPRTVTVQILGTHRFANVDARGAFEFRGLAGGDYSVRLASTLGEYTPTFTAFSAASGRTLDLPDTLRLIYTGIPAVTGLGGRFDAAAGIMRLTWDATTYPRLDQYVVYRTVGLTATAPAEPIALVTGPGFSDTLYRAPGDTAGAKDAPPFSRKDGRAIPLEYRVKIRSLTEAIGPAYGSFRATAVSPNQVETGTSLYAEGRPDRLATINDTIKLVLTFANPTRRIRKVSWFRGTDTAAFRVLLPAGQSGRDSIVLVSAGVPGDTAFRAEVIDDAGAVVADAIAIQIIDDTPELTVDIGHPVARMGDTLRFRGRAKERGRIVKWEWDIGNKGVFVPASGPDTAFPTPSRPYRDGDFFCALRATDEDGRVRKEVFGMTISAWQKRRGLITPRRGFGAAALGGRIYVAGGIHTFSSAIYALDLVEAYDPAADAWIQVRPMSVPRIGLELIERGGKLYAIGGGRLSPSNPGEWITYSTVEEYDPTADQWRVLPPIESAQYNVGGVEMGGRLFLLSLPRAFSPSQVQAYDPATGITTHPFPIFKALSLQAEFARISAVTWKGRIHAFGSLESGSTTPVVLDTAAGTVEQMPGPSFSGTSVAAAASGQSVLLTGLDAMGGAPGKPGTKVTLFDLESGVVAPKSPLARPRLGGRVINLEGRFYAIGGYRAEAGGANVFNTDMEMLDLALDP